MNATKLIETTESNAAPAATSETGTTQEAPPRDVRRWLEANECVLIDVREADEHRREKIPGSQLVPLSRFDPQQAFESAGPGQKIVFHCRSGRRAADAVRMAGPLAGRQHRVFNMTGGIEAWKSAGFPIMVNSRAPRINIMRQVQLVIGLCVLLGSALAWLVDPRYVAIPAFFGAGLTFAGATGTCALATLIGWMPWNKTDAAATQCTSGSCA